MKRIEYTITPSDQPINEAKLILMGEIHTSLLILQQRQQREWIREHTYPGDIILGESFSRGQKVPWLLANFLYGSPKGTTTLGWDDQKILKEARPAFRGERRKNKKADKLLSQKLYDSKVSQEELRTLALQQATVRITRRDVALSRNESMIHAIKDAYANLPPENKIIVIAGMLHFEQRDILDYVSQYPFVLLRPTNNITK